MAVRAERHRRVTKLGAQARPELELMPEAEETERETPPWIVTYSDLISQLMVFFILFFSVTKEGRISELEEALAQFQGKQEVVEREFQPGEVVLRIAGSVLFDSGKADLRPEALPVLDKAYRMIRDNLLTYGPAMIRVEGHTDNVPIHTAKFPSNWELSAARAVSVVRYFLDRGYFSPEDLQLMGYGEFKPIADNSTPEGRRRNRRVEIKIVRSNILPEEERGPAPADQESWGQAPSMDGGSQSAPSEKETGRSAVRVGAGPA